MDMGRSCAEIGGKRIRGGCNEKGNAQKRVVQERRGQIVTTQLFGDGQDSNGDGQIKARTFFTQIGRGQINHNTARWKFISGVFDSGVYSFFALFNGWCQVALQCSMQVVLPLRPLQYPPGKLIILIRLYFLIAPA